MFSSVIRWQVDQLIQIYIIPGDQTNQFLLYFTFKLCCEDLSYIIFPLLNVLGGFGNDYNDLQELESNCGFR